MSLRAKPRFVRYRDLDAASCNFELQLHTSWTDGEPQIGEVLARASECGLAGIAFTEHVRRETDWFPQFAHEVHEAAAGFPRMLTYLGCETKAMDLNGALDVTEGILAECDIVLGVVHRFPDGKGGYMDYKLMAPDEMAELECELSLGMIRNAPIDVLGHPGGMYQRRHGAYPQKLFRAMMEATVKRGIAIEINSSYLVDMPGFLSLCEEINPIVSIGSDAHKLDEIGRCRDLVRKALNL
jgi:putative hydrolase